MDGERARERAQTIVEGANSTRARIADGACVPCCRTDLAASGSDATDRMEESREESISIHDGRTEAKAKDPIYAQYWSRVVL